MGKQIILIFRRKCGMWVVFYDKNFGLKDNEQYVCDLTPKQVLQIMNSNSYESTIDVSLNVIEELGIDYEIIPKYENKRYFIQERRTNNENN